MDLSKDADIELPGWQKEMIDVRLNDIRETPERRL